MITRRQALGTAAVALAARPAAALAADNDDRQPLEALVAYQQEVVFGYVVALREAPFGDRDRGTLEPFRRDATLASAALRRALEAADGKAPAAPDADNPPPRTDNSRAAFLRDLITVEETAVASYYTALQGLEEKRHLNGAAAFMAQAGRRLVVLRHLAGEPLLPRAFETGGA
jgi:hypothetical protein